MIHRRRARRKRGYLTAAGEAHEEASERWYGSAGPASPVRRIDPATGKVAETAEPAADII